MKPREFWILTLDGFTLPGVVDSKELADNLVEMTRRSNNPNYIHVREVVPIDWEGIGEKLFSEIKHGDEKHQAWLNDAIQAFFRKQLAGEE